MYACRKKRWPNKCINKCKEIVVNMVHYKVAITLSQVSQHLLATPSS